MAEYIVFKEKDTFKAIITSPISTHVYYDDKFLKNNYPLRTIKTKSGKAIVMVDSTLQCVQLILANLNILTRNRITFEFLANEYFPYISEIIENYPGFSKPIDFSIVIILDNTTFSISENGYVREEVVQYSSMGLYEIFKGIQSLNEYEGKELLTKSMALNFEVNCDPKIDLIYIDNKTFKTSFIKGAK